MTSGRKLLQQVHRGAAKGGGTLGTGPTSASKTPPRAPGYWCDKVFADPANSFIPVLFSLKERDVTLKKCNAALVMSHAALCVQNADR